MQSCGYVRLLVLTFLFGVNCATTVTTDDEYVVLSRYYSNGSLSQGANVIRIGTPLTLDNGLRYSEMSRYVQQGYELYFHWLNTNRGGVRINGITHPVELVLVNDFSSESLARDAAEVLASKYQVSLFLGPYGSTLSDAVASVVVNHGATMLAPMSSRPSVVTGRSQVFSLGSPASSAAIALSMLSQQSPKPTTLAFLQEEDAFDEVCDALKGLASKYSMQNVFSATLPPAWGSIANSTSIPTVVASLASAKPDVVIGCTYQDVCRGLILEASANDWNPQAFLFTACSSSSSFGDEADVLAYVLGTTTWHRLEPTTCELTGMSASGFIQEYSAKYQDPVDVGAAAFAASATLVHAIELANSVDPALVANSIRTMDVNTVYGRVHFDSTGLNKNEFKIMEHGFGGQTKMIAPALVSTGSITYPKPTWFDLKCLQTGTGLSKFGYNQGDTLGETCGVCPRGEVGNLTVMADGSSKRVCTSCAIGEVLDVVGASLSCTECSAGHFWCGTGWTPPLYGDWVSSFEREDILCVPDGPSSCLTCPRGRYQDETGQTICKECTVGKYMNDLGGTACRTCNATELGSEVRQTFAATNATITCIDCPKGAICEPDEDGLYSGYTNADGYYLVKEVDYDSDYSLGRLHKCPNGDGDACVAREQCYKDPDTGEVAMEGIFCGNCRSGFAQGEIGGVCTKCPSAFESYLAHFTGQLLVFVLSLALSINQFLKDPRTIPPTASVVLRQFLNYVQLSTVVLPATQLSDVGHNIVRDTEFLQILMAARGSQTATKGTECFLKHILPDLKIFESYTLAGLLMVPMWLLVDLCFFFLFKGIAMCSGFPRPGYAQLATGITLNLFIVQPRLTKVFLIPFRCQFLDTTRLTIHMDVECDSEEAVKWQGIAFLGLIVLPIGIPLFLMGILRYLKSQRKLFSTSSIKIFGFVFQGLRPEYYYFECVNMIRKVVFQIAANLPWLSPNGANEDLEKALVSFSLVMVSVIFLGVHLRCRPYDSRHFNILDRIEASILWAILATCLMQSWRHMSDSSWVFSKSTNQSRNRGIRDALCTSIVLLFHVRCICFMILGVFSQYLRSKQWFIYCFGGGSNVSVDANGIRVAKLSSTARNVLVDAVTNTTLQQLRSSHLDYSMLNDAMRRICIEALYQQDRNEFTRKHVIAGVAMKLKEIFKVTPDFIDSYMKNQVLTMANGLPGWVLDPHYQYSPDDIYQAAERTFGAADLHMEAIRLNWSEDSRPSKRSSRGTSGFGFLKMRSQKVQQDPDEGGPDLQLQSLTIPSPVPTVAPPPQRVLKFGPQRISAVNAERASLLKALQFKDSQLAALKKSAGEEQDKIQTSQRTPGDISAPETKILSAPETEILEDAPVAHGDIDEPQPSNNVTKATPRSVSASSRSNSDESV